MSAVTLTRPLDFEAASFGGCTISLLLNSKMESLASPAAASASAEVNREAFDAARERLNPAQTTNGVASKERSGDLRTA